MTPSQEWEVRGYFFVVLTAVTNDSWFVPLAAVLSVLSFVISVVEGRRPVAS